MLLTRNFQPSAALSPFISRYNIFSSDTPGFELSDFSLADSAALCLTWGDWWIEASPGTWRRMPGITFAGPASRAIRIRMKSPCQLIGISFRPSGWKALFQRPANEFADSVMPFADLWPKSASCLDEAMLNDSEPRKIIQTVEDEIIRHLSGIGSWEADEAMLMFEHIAQIDSTRQVKDVAAQLGLSPRQFERHCLAHFGHSPKLVLRRSRFLDMASVLRGLGSASNEQLAELRYFDQSHRNREFKKFIGMTPQQFVQAPTPLFTPALRMRLLPNAEAERVRG